MNNFMKKGITLFGIIWVLIFVFVILAIVSNIFRSCVSSTTGVDQSSAESFAKNWANSMGIKDAKVTCVNLDSDGDGYVSCTVGHTDSTGFKVQALECASKFSLNSGCKIPVNRLVK